MDVKTATCKILGITPGDYHAYALPADIEIDYRDPDSFKALEKFGIAVKLGKGQRQEIELKPALMD